jgi:hypothetical protein
MFEFESIQDFICKSLIGKVLVKVGDVVLNEKIEKAWYDPATNSIVVYSDKSQTYIYNSSFVLVNKLIEIDWDSYRKREQPKFGYASPYAFGLDENEDYADVYTTQEFYEHVKSGLFIDSDGHGYPSNGTHHLYAGLGVRDLAACKYSKTVSHIIWYNK